MNGKRMLTIGLVAALPVAIGATVYAQDRFDKYSL